MRELNVGTNLVSAGRAADSPPILAYNPARRLVAWGRKTNEVHIAALDEPGRHTQWNSAFSNPVPLEFSPDGTLIVLGQPIPKRGLEVREAMTGRLVVQPSFGETRTGGLSVGRGTRVRGGFAGLRVSRPLARVPARVGRGRCGYFPSTTTMMSSSRRTSSSSPCTFTV